MPDNMLITGGSMVARPRGCGPYAAIPAVAYLASATTAYANNPPGGGIRGATANVGAPEIAGLALVFSVLCFAVVTAILLVRTRRELAGTQTAARDAIAAAKAESDHANALLRAEPHIRI